MSDDEKSPESSRRPTLPPIRDILGHELHNSPRQPPARLRNAPFGFTPLDSTLDDDNNNPPRRPSYGHAPADQGRAAYGAPHPQTRGTDLYTRRPTTPGPSRMPREQPTRITSPPPAPSAASRSHSASSSNSTAYMRPGAQHEMRHKSRSISGSLSTSFPHRMELDEEDELTPTILRTADWGSVTRRMSVDSSDSGRSVDRDESMYSASPRPPHKAMQFQALTSGNPFATNSPALVPSGLPAAAPPPQYGYYGQPMQARDRRLVHQADPGPPATRQRSASYGQSSHDEAYADNNAFSAAKYVCEFCDKRFTRPSSLKIHRNSHTGEKPYQCPYPGCGRRFSVQSNMRRHGRVHMQGSSRHQESSGEEGGDSMSSSQSRVSSSPPTRFSQASSEQVGEGSASVHLSASSGMAGGSIQAPPLRTVSGRRQEGGSASGMQREQRMYHSDEGARLQAYRPPSRASSWDPKSSHHQGK